jgi:hypothetical protein
MEPICGYRICGKKSQNAVVTDKRMTPAWFVTLIWSLGNSAAANLPQQSVARVEPVAPKAFSVGAANLVPTSLCGVTLIVPMTATGLTCVMRN